MGTGSACLYLARHEQCLELFRDVGGAMRDVQVADDEHEHLPQELAADSVRAARVIGRVITQKRRAWQRAIAFA